ncbi:creatininase family protein [Variovorax terrae]|uniref:Creatininase family protein n=1 Tax=Variovorax terrae TaxID=2923278 RepID=A0A9X2AP44_9BURK|nr:creatininase family protein [Variovorax terrae]MCJ0764465.1 creatininase family protein [Variovorax terrae]
MSNKFFWTDHTSGELAGRDTAGTVVIIPLGATEQHGPHLPLSVDVDIVEAVLARLQALRPDELPVVRLPTLGIGKSNEHISFPGTLTLSAETLLRLWMEVADCVVRAGFRRLLFLNSHGGQGGLADALARDVRVRHGVLAVTASTYSLGVPEGSLSEAEMRHGIHAGQEETSVMLAFRPGLVQMDKARRFDSRSAALEQDFTRLSLQARGRLAWQIEDLNEQGACGDAAAASAELGQRLIDCAAAGLLELLRDMVRYDMKNLRHRAIFTTGETTDAT